jgi:hypothetical protein
MEPQAERFTRYLAHLTAMGILDCRNPLLAAHQFMGMLNELSLWPWMTGRESLPVPEKDIIKETIRMFLQHYRTRDRKGTFMQARHDAPAPVRSGRRAGPNRA